MARIDNWFFEQVRILRDHGEIRSGRNGGTKARFVEHLTLDVSREIPILTCKKTNFAASVGEMVAFMKGAKTAKEFRDLACPFWDSNAKADYWTSNPAYKAASKEEQEAGYLGRIYGVQWREWAGVEGAIDQLQNLLERMRKDPHSRYHIVSAWNPADLKNMALAPCHMFFQVYCHSDGGLSLHMHQRSCDLFLGVPYNILGYSILLHLLAKLTGRTAKNLSITFGDFHIYDTHEEAIRILFANDVQYEAPTMEVEDSEDWLTRDFKDTSWLTPTLFKLVNYQHGPFIPAPMSQ